MTQEIEAIKEAIQFIKDTWITKARFWEGTASEFASAIKGPVTLEDVEALAEALEQGQWTPFDDLEATEEKGLRVRR